MQDDTFLQRFQKFKSMIISSNVPNNVLLEMAENFIFSDNNEQVTESIPIMDGQLSLFDCAA